MMTALLVASFASLVIWILACAVVADQYAKFPRLEPSTYPGPPEPAPRVTVLVPAKDEEGSIAQCLETLAAQDYPNFEVLLIDDRSEDRTGEIGAAFAARDARFRVLRSKDLPEGWAGKCHALWQGVEATESEFILMMDADAFAHPRCLTQTVCDALDKRADLYTIEFEQTCLTFWEKVVQPFMTMLILLGFPREKVNDPASSAAIAPGPFLLFRRDAYLAIGGHAAIKDELVEDMRLAQRIKETGHRL
ncbi:MAG: glycosyltransferase, partial [Myxococcales bacterium]|nr:glycosyltransferase [Myxococcales bacterium]